MQRSLQYPPSPQQSQFIMSKLQQIIPELKQQLKIQARNELTQRNNQLLQEKKQQLKNHYMEELKFQVAQINDNIKAKMIKAQQQLNKLKVEFKDKKTLTKEEEDEIVEATVEGILKQPLMVNEIKLKMMPKVEGKVQSLLEEKMNEIQQETRKAIEQEFSHKRQEWENERRQYWKKIAQSQLIKLDQQYKQLEQKKIMIENSLQQKKQQRDNMKKKLNQIYATNCQIDQLKKQISAIQREMK